MDFSSQIIKILNELGKKFGMAIDFSQQNIVPQIQDFMARYVKYETYTSIMWLVLGVIFIILGAILWVYVAKEIIDDWDGFIYMFVTILLSTGIGVGICQILDIIKVNTIPEIYFIDYIKTLMQ